MNPSTSRPDLMPASQPDPAREALLRIFDMAEDRPDIRDVARTALATLPDSGERPKCPACGWTHERRGDLCPR